MEQKDLERDELIEWCALLSSYSREYFIKKSTSELKEEYEKLIGRKQLCK